MTFADRSPRDCNKGGGHEWEHGHDAWGVVLGISRCDKCGETARSEHFTPREEEQQP